MPLTNADKWYAGWAKAPSKSIHVPLSERTSLQNATITSTVTPDSGMPRTEAARPDKNLPPIPTSAGTDPQPVEGPPAAPDAEAFAKLAAELAQLKASNGRLKAETRQKTAQLLDHDKVKTDLEQARSEITELRLAVSQRNQLEDELERIREECSKLRKLAETHEREAMTEKHRNLALEGHTTALRRLAEGHEQVAIKGKQMNIVLEQQVSALNRVKEAFKKQLQTKMAETAEAELKLNGMQEELKTVTDANEQLAARVASKKKRLLKALRKLNEKELALILVQKNEKKYRTHMDEVLTERDGQLAALSNEKLQLESRHQKMMGELQDKEKQLELQEQELSELRAEQHRVAAALADAEEQSTMITKQHEDTLAELDSVRLNSETYRANMDEIIDQREARIEELAQEKLKLEGRLKTLEDELKEKGRELEHREQDLSGMRADLEGSREAVTLVTQLYDENITKLTKEMADLEGSLSKHFSELTLKAKQQTVPTLPNSAGRKKSSGGKAHVQKRIDEEFQQVPKEGPPSVEIACDDEIQVLHRASTPRPNVESPVMTNGEKKKGMKRSGGKKPTISAQIEACRSLGISEKFVRDVRKVTLAEKLKRKLSMQPSLTPSGEGSQEK